MAQQKKQIDPERWDHAVELLAMWQGDAQAKADDMYTIGVATGMEIIMSVLEGRGTRVSHLGNREEEE